MAVIEFQVRTQAFLNLFKSEFNSRRLSGWTLPFPGLEGYPLQQIQCVNATIEPSLGEGRVRIQAELVVFYSESLDEVQAAGSLQRPVMHERPMTLPVDFSIGFDAAGQPSLRWSMLFGLASGTFPITLPDDTPVSVAAIDASETVVCVRLGTAPADPINTPIVDRTGGHDWTQIVSGQIIADTFTRNFATALQGAYDASLVHESGPSGAWFPATPDRGPIVAVSATVVAVDACLFDIDVPVDLQLTGALTPTGPSLVTTLELSWEPDSTLCEIVGGLLFTPIASVVINNIADDKAASEILGRTQPFEGFEEIGRSDEHIVYRRRSLIATPGARFKLTTSVVTDDGLVSFGAVTVPFSGRNLDGEVTEPSSTLHADCTTRSVSVQFHQPVVYLRDLGLGGPPRLFAERVLFQPPGAWSAAVTPGQSWLDLVIVFNDPPGGRLAPGTHTSVFLPTDCGLRWADLGVIPVPHPPPTLADTAHMISNCMALSDPWGMGIMNLEWLVDPPDLLGIADPLREWVIGARELPEGTRLEVLAVARDGRERSLGVVEGQRNAALHLLTGADERLRLRTGRPLSAPAPTVFQRWIVPVSAMQLDVEPTALASSGGQLAVRDSKEQTHLVEIDSEGRLHTRAVDARPGVEPALDSLIGALARNQRRHLAGGGTIPARLDRHTVAVVHRGSLIIGRSLAPRRM